MHSGIRTEQRAEAGQAEQGNRCNGIGIAGCMFALAAAAALSAVFWAGQAVVALLVLRIAALVLAAAGTVLCGVGVGRAGARRLNGFAFCGLLLGAAVLCLCAPQLVGMLS